MNLLGGVPDKFHSLSRIALLQLSVNNLTGSIPSSLGNLSSLVYLYLPRNSLEGSIPNELGRLVSLKHLSIGQNKISGIIPHSLLNISSIVIFAVPANQLDGSIPPNLGLTLPNLEQLWVDVNLFTGPIPVSLANASRLTHIDFSYNNFSGSLPMNLGSLQGLNHLSLQRNQLGSWGKLNDLIFLTSLTNCSRLQVLSLANNYISGVLPDSIANLSSQLTLLALGRNQISSSIPLGIENLVALTSLGMDENSLTELQLPPCSVQVYRKSSRSHSLRAIISITSPILCLILFSCFFSLFYWIRKSRKESRKEHSTTSSLEDQCLKVSYAELLRATNGFSLDNLIGVGSYGSVYKGILGINQIAIAVKVLNLQQRGAYKSFDAECQAWRNIRHRNLVKILTSCSSIDFHGNDFKALVFEYMPNGSLEKWLPQNGNGQHPLRNLSLIQRLNIASDVASALDYLHHHGQIPIIHRDLKPSNILLDVDMNAHVGDFGLAKFLLDATDHCSKNQTNSTGMKGSIGYVAPEYGMGGHASTHGDVYSYGILLLEMFTAKMPTDKMFIDGLSLYQFVKMIK
ncbi:putative LRR receptor-like serine/threonine-protein kinase At3g47570 [Tasmannia lanceolata]|uniref:putative LRR receptor-like serine/threonine-protein kinase At3g47570 n=1 Tax=Tasmannia lanceolata TaxID=3420 RepID=UPI004062D4C0